MKKLRGLLGFTGYYYNFVKNDGQIATPLTTILKNEAFSWTEEETRAFETLKEALCTTLILATLDFTKKIVMECDASNHGIGEVLM